MATLPQTLTPYHAKCCTVASRAQFAPDSDDRLANALVDAQVDLNPHQIDAALFSFKSPLSRGVLLADEVGLGKTIEAGLVLAQKWAERKRRILVITPSNLRKQWHQELTDKFFLPCRILEAKSYNDAIKLASSGRSSWTVRSSSALTSSPETRRLTFTTRPGTSW